MHVILFKVKFGKAAPKLSLDVQLNNLQLSFGLGDSCASPAESVLRTTISVVLLCSAFSGVSGVDPNGLTCSVGHYDHSQKIW